jgi:hypothetical protein
MKETGYKRDDRGIAAPAWQRLANDASTWLDVQLGSDLALVIELLTTLMHDEGSRPGTTHEKLASLKAVIQDGVVTEASPLQDALRKKWASALSMQCQSLLRDTA